MATASMTAQQGVELRLGLPYPVLAAAYCRWRAEDLFSLISYRNPNMSLVEWLDWNYQPSGTVEPVGCYVGEALVGIGWICQAHVVEGYLVAEVGAAFFKGTPLSVWRQGLEMLLAHAFVDRGFARIYGTSAPHNRAARVLVRSCGMEPAESLPWPEDLPPGTVVHALDWMTWARRNYDGKRN